MSYTAEQDYSCQKVDMSGRERGKKTICKSAQSSRKIDNYMEKRQQKLSTVKKLYLGGNMTYAPTYTHYPQSKNKKIKN